MAAFSVTLKMRLTSIAFTLFPPLRSPFSCILFSSHTIAPQTPHPPISLFLLTECEFSPSQVSKIMQTYKAFFKTRSSHTAREAVEFLKQCGFARPQLHRTILRYPPLLALKVDTQLNPKFGYFRTLGFTDQELVKLISTCPTVIGLNLECNLISKISFLQTVFGPKPNLIKALKRSPSLLVKSVKKEMKPKLDFFEQWGIRGELLSFLLSTKPDILARFSIKSLSGRMEYARNTMGIEQGSKQFVYMILALISNGPQTVEKKMKHLQCLGFQEDEVREILKKRSFLLQCSTKKIQKNMDFLTQTAGLKTKIIFSNPLLLQYSVKKRLMPRYAIFKAISSEQQSLPSLLTIFRFSERRFLEQIVECNPQASTLKEIYKGKQMKQWRAFVDK